MLTLDLARLEREGTLPVEADVPPDHALWDSSGLCFATPLRVRLRASAAGSGEIVIRGSLRSILDMQCRRCLDPVLVPLDEEVTMVFAPSDELEEEEEVDVRRLPARASSLDLSDAIREELILGTDRYVVCEEGCKGLCPICGVNRNQQTCECTLEEPDARWDTLRALKSE
jgi:uncharacterized protein